MITAVRLPVDAHQGLGLVYATGGQRLLLPIVLAGASLTLVGDFALIPSLGLVGAGISVATVQPLVAAGTLLVARRVVARIVPVRGLTIAAAVVALACGVALNRGGSPGGAVAVATSLYWVVCSFDPSVQRLMASVWGQLRVAAARLAGS